MASTGNVSVSVQEGATVGPDPSYFKVRSWLTCDQIEDNRVHYQGTSFITVTAGNFNGATVSVSGTLFTGDVNIGAPGAYATHQKVDLGWFTVGQTCSVSITAQYTSENGTTYRSTCTSTASGGGTRDMVEDMTVSVDGRSYTSGSNIIPVPPDKNVDIVVTREGVTPFPSIVMRTAIYDLYAYPVSKSGAGATTLSFSTNPYVLYLNAKAKGDYEAKVKAWSGLDEMTGVGKQYYDEVMYGYIGVYFSIGSYTTAVLKAVYCTFDFRAQTLTIYDSAGKAHSGVPFVYDSAGKLRDVVKITVYDSAGKAH